VVFRQVAAHEFSLLVVAAFLDAEQVGVEGADALDDQVFALWPLVFGATGRCK